MKRLSGIWVMVLFAVGCAATDEAPSRAPSEENRVELGPQLGIAGMTGSRGHGPSPGASRLSEEGYSRGLSRRRGDHEQDFHGEITIERGMERKAPDGRRVVFDVLHAKGPSKDPGQAPLPVVIILGGDGQRPVRYHSDVVAMVGSGKFVCLSVTTTAIVDATRPAQATECQAVIGWLRDNAEDYSMHPGRIGIWVRFADADFVCTLERGTTDVLTSQLITRGDCSWEPDQPPPRNNVAAFFNRNLRGEKESLSGKSPRGRRLGGMRSPRF
jgi:hypothetical protein